MEDGTSKSLRHTGDTDPGCELRNILDRIADKWSLMVIYVLADGVRRFTELRREIDGISQRMLTLTLRQLEREGLVRRTVFAVVPPRVDYELTPLGSTLLDTIQSLVAWAGEHGNEIADARAAYDVRAEADEARRPPSADTPSVAPYAIAGLDLTCHCKWF
jgi:DNA-binding HxlR family transcriptional regulator